MYQFEKVFDVVDSGYKDWGFPAFGLIFVVLFITAIAFPKAFEKSRSVRSSSWRLFYCACLIFAILWTTGALVVSYTEYLRHSALAQSNTCRIVEGPVEQFVPMPYTGHANESFSVSGVRFSYSDFGVTDAFNNTSSHGGPINKDSYVRICYDPSDNAILRLEIGHTGGLSGLLRRNDE